MPLEVGMICFLLLLKLGLLMNNPFAPRTHIEVFINQGGNITIKTIEDERNSNMIAVSPAQIDDLIKALQACRDEIKN
jgi:hypothetical protein